MHRGINYYTILGIDPCATRGEVKRAYRRLAKQYHPDLNPDNPSAEEQYSQIYKAYEILYDSRARNIYDTALETGKTFTYSKPKSEKLPIFHSMVLTSLGILLIVIPLLMPLLTPANTTHNYDTTLAKRITMHFIFLVSHGLVSSFLVGRSYKPFKDDYVLLAVIIVVVHGCSALISALITFIISGYINYISAVIQLTRGFN